MRHWLSRYRWKLVHSLRMTTASIAAYASAYLLALPDELSAAITALVVTQSNVGGSLKTAVEQLAGSLFGAVYAAAVALAILPDDTISTAAALAVALAPLSILAARSPGFRIAPITAAIVLLGGASLHVAPLSLAAHRLLGVGLGCGIGLLVSMIIMPARASRSVVETAGRIASLMADQLEALSTRENTGEADLGSKAIEIRENLVRLSDFVEQSSHERRAWLAEAPDGQRLLRTLRRLRHDVDMLRRSAREAGSDALHERAAPPWQKAAESGASSLRSVSRLMAGQPVPENLNTLAEAVRDYRAGLDEMRRSGVTHSLSTAALGRLFGIGFALEQFRRDLDDLIEVARETSRLHRRFTGTEIRREQDPATR